MFTKMGFESSVSKMDMKQGQQGTTLLEVVVAATILLILIVAFSGLLRSITVGGRNMPTTSGNVLTRQQVLDQINTFLIQFSRDVQGASTIKDEDSGKKITLGNVVYEFQEAEGKIQRNGKTVLRGVYWDNKEIFKKGSDGSVTVTLLVRYLSQTGRGENAFEKQPFSFVVQRRVSPSPSP